jgi:hypothetical protein
MNYFIFRIKEKSAQYLRKDFTWSENKSEAWLMSEEEASNNCNEYTEDGWTAGCGSLN